VSGFTLRIYLSEVLKKNPAPQGPGELARRSITAGGLIRKFVLIDQPEWNFF